MNVNLLFTNQYRPDQDLFHLRINCQIDIIHAAWELAGSKNFSIVCTGSHTGQKLPVPAYFLMDIKLELRLNYYKLAV